MNKKIVSIVVIVAIAGISFYAGMRYGGNNVMNAQSARFAQGGNFGQRGTRGNGPGSGFATGSVLSQDANGITIQLRNGGSQIVLISSSTPIMKSISGAQSDIKTGENVMITGTTNPDGSLTAQSIQIRQ